MSIRGKETVLKYTTNAINLFADMRKARKAEKQNSRAAEQEAVIKRVMLIPVFDTGIGFLDTVEGCTLYNCKMREVYEIAKKAFDGLPYEVKHKLTSAPEDGEFVERAQFWKELLQPVMSRGQCHVAMLKILDWFMHIKKMRKCGAVE